MRVHQAKSRLRICPIDWETAAIGPGLIDLAALTAGKWSDAEKRTMALAYHRKLVEVGPWKPAEDEFLSALDCCRLHQAFQWLGWSLDWSPSRRKAYDWLGEVVAVAERLGLEG